MIWGILAVLLFALTYFIVIKPFLIYFKAVRAFGFNGVIFIFAPRYTSIQLYQKMSRKDGDSMKFLRQQVAKKPQAKIMIVGFFLYSFIYVLDTAIIRSVTNDHIHSMEKKTFMFSNLIDKGLLFSSGQTWKNSRLILSNLFHFDVLKSREHIMNEIIDSTIQDLESKTVNLFDLGLQISGQITLQSFLGQKFADIKFGQKRVLKQIRQIIDDLLVKTIQPFWILRLGITAMGSPPDWMLTKQQIILKQRIIRFKKITKQFLEKQLQQFQNNKPVSSNFIETYFKQKPGAEYIQQMIDQIFIFLVAGQDTTGMLIQASLMYLSENPDYQQKILNQYNANPTELHRNKLLNNFINQVLRMRGPTRNSLIRQVKKPFTVEGFTFQKGYLPVVAFGIVMMNPKHFDNPQTFNPQRWNHPLQNQLSFTPFFSGPHNCIGQHMALMEARIALIKIISKYFMLRTNVPDRITLISLLYKMKNHELVQFIKR